MDSRPVSNANTTGTLIPEAQYGMLPFDRFVLDHWGYGRTVEQDQQQWDELARKWLALDHIGRNPYWEFCWEIVNKMPEVSRLPTQDQIDRVLAPHQTIKERNLSSYAGGRLPVWLRTCYAPDLTPAYEEMAVYNDKGMREDRLRLLNDETLYGNFGQNWARIFLRLPILPDVIPYMGEPHVDVEIHQLQGIDPPEDESEMPLYNAALKEGSVIYVLDEEALKEKVLKIYWLDLHGNSVWYNKMKPQDTTSYEARGTGGERLWEFLDKCYADPSLREPGVWAAPANIANGMTYNKLQYFNCKFDFVGSAFVNGNGKRSLPIGYFNGEAVYGASRVKDTKVIEVDVPVHEMPLPDSRTSFPLDD